MSETVIFQDVQQARRKACDLWLELQEIPKRIRSLESEMEDLVTEAQITAAIEQRNSLKVRAEALPLLIRHALVNAYELDAELKLAERQALQPEIATARAAVEQCQVERETAEQREKAARALLDSLESNSVAHQRNAVECGSEINTLKQKAQGRELVEHIDQRCSELLRHMPPQERPQLRAA